MPETQPPIALRGLTVARPQKLPGERRRSPAGVWSGGAFFPLEPR